METVKSRKTGKSRGAGRSRAWAAVVYPESAAEGWREILTELHISGFISPLHDSDINPDSTQKKPHYHVLLVWESVKTAQQAAEVWKAIGAVPEGRPVNSVRGYARYLVHMDNPEKHQYDPADIVSLSGADWAAVTHLPTDDFSTVKEMCAFIRKNRIYSFAAFFDLCAEKYDDWANALIKGGCLGVIKEYQRSLYWEAQQEARQALVTQQEIKRDIDKADAIADKIERETGVARVLVDIRTGEIVSEED